MPSSEPFNKVARGRKVWIILVTLFWSLILFYMTWGEGWRDLTDGRYHRKCVEMFSRIDDTTEVQLFLLDGEESQKRTDVFRVGYLGKSYPVYGTKSITAGPELDEFKRLWYTQQTDPGIGAMCHDPPYGFRLYQNGILVKEVTICWGCWNFCVQIWPGKDAYRGFDARSDQAKALLAFCDKRLPYKRAPSQVTSPDEK